MWLFKKSPSITMNELLKKELRKGSLLDVRTIQEFNQGHIKGAINVPIDKLDHFNGDRRQTYYVICQSGMRSKRASKQLAKKGYQVFNVLGGMNHYPSSTKGGI